MKPTLEFRSIAMLLFTALSLGFSAVHVTANDTKTTGLYLSDSTVQVKNIQSLDDNTQATFQLIDGIRQVAAEKIVRFGARRIPSKFSTLILSDGSLIAGNWLGVSSGVVKWDASTFGTLEVPLAFVRAIVLKPVGGTKSWLELEQIILSDTSNVDRVLIDDAGWTNGIVCFPSSGDSEFDAGQSNAIIELKTDTKNSALSINKIQCMIFSSAFAPNAQLNSNIQIGLTDGTLLKTSGWTVDSQSVCHFKLAIPLDLALPVNDRLGKQVCYLLATPQDCRFLSDLQPANFRHLPQWTTKLELGLNRSVFGEPLIVGNTLFVRGIATPGSSQASFRLDGLQQKLVAELVLPPSRDADQSVGSVIAKVLVSKNRKLQTVYTSETLHPGDAAVAVEADLSGGELLVLLVEPASHGDSGDQLFWIDCRLVKSAEEK